MNTLTCSAGINGIFLTMKMIFAPPQDVYSVFRAVCHLLVFLCISAFLLLEMTQVPFISL